MKKAKPSPPAENTPRKKSVVTTRDVIKRLELMGRLLELVDANPFKIRAFYNAAMALESLPEDLASMVASRELLDVSGIGKGIFSHIEQMLETGTFTEYEELRKTLPDGLLDMLRIPGLGPKKVKAIYEELDVKSIDELEAVAKKGGIADLEGFGEKSQQNILRGIDRFRTYRKRYLLSTALNEGNGIFKALQDHPDVERSLLGGSLRRRKETVKDIDILVSAKTSDAIMEMFTTLPQVSTIIGRGDTKSSVVLKSGINVDLRVVNDHEFPFAALYFTGSKEHNTDMRARAKKMGYKLNEYGLFKNDKSVTCKDEAAVFKKMGLDYIPPEIRESQGEIEAAETHTLPKLVTESDIKGIFHVHTTYSDGKGSLADMAKAAKALGMTYLGVSDHSQSAVYAGGMKIEKVEEQAREIAAFNRTSKDFRILAGVESDILPDGTLDYPDEILATFDFVIIAIHSNLNLDEAAMTKRIVTAIENPHTTMVGHPAGRLLLRREAYKVDINAIIDAAAANNVIIEINSNPNRLDLDWRYLRAARDKGVKIAIGPDAHSTDGLEDFRYGVAVARKGWLTNADVINTITANEIEPFLRTRRRS